MKKRTAVEAVSGPPRIAVFTGDDTMGRERARVNLLAAIRAEHPDALEQPFDDTVETLDECAVRMITPSLFESARIFIFRHVERFSKAQIAALAAALRNTIPGVFAIIECGDDGGKKDPVKAALEGLGCAKLAKSDPDQCAIFDFVKPPEYKMASWLAEQAPRLFGRQISKQDAEYLVECVGADVGVLYSELQKIDIHLPAKAAVDHDAIETIVAASRMPEPFELAQALGRRDFCRALDILDALFSSNFYAPPALSAIFRHFWALARIRAFAKAHPDTMKRYRSARYDAQTAIAREIGVAAGLLSADDSPKRAYPVVILSGIVEQARGFTDQELRGIIPMLCEFDVGVKTGHVDADKRAMQDLCYRVVRAQYMDKAEAA